MEDEEVRPSPARQVQFRPMADRNSSTIRLRRLRSQDPGPGQPTEPNAPSDSNEIDFAQPSPISTRGRPRSSTIPPRSTHETAAPLARLPSLPEATPFRPQFEHEDGVDSDKPLRPHAGAVQPPTTDRRTLRSRSSAMLSGLNFSRPQRHSQPQEDTPGDCYDARIVDMLDVIDPEVSTLSSITNVQNSLFVPSLGRYLNRQPTYDLDSLPEPLKRSKTASTRGLGGGETGSVKEGGQETSPVISRQGSLMFDVGERYAVLPNDTTVEGWSKEDVALLNDYVRHMLHSRRSKIKRSFQAFGKYVRKPLGFFVTLYATLITLFGLAWVLFLIGWIYVGERQPYATNVIDYVLVALFAVVGDGLAPFRAVDTYHMIFIARYHRLTWKLRKKMALPKLEDQNDLPTNLPPCDQARNVDLEQGLQDMPRPQDGGTHHAKHERSVLTLKQQATLVHHQNKYAKSHTFYKPHETETHHAFPLRLLIAIQVLLDLHSCLQISLGAVTWGIHYEDRPMALTATILSCSITANVTAGILISIGDHRTRKKDVLDRMFRQELTETAIKKVKKRQEERASMEGERPSKFETKKDGKEQTIEEDNEEDAEELVMGRKADDKEI